MYIYSEIVVFILFIMSFYISKSNILIVEFPHFLRKCLFLPFPRLILIKCNLGDSKLTSMTFSTQVIFTFTTRVVFLLQSTALYILHISLFLFMELLLLVFLAPQNLVLFLNHSTTKRLGLWDFDWGTVVTLALSIHVSMSLFFLRIFNAFINHFGVIQP